jgi:hypothetical protein
MGSLRKGKNWKQEREVELVFPSACIAYEITQPTAVKTDILSSY